MLELSDREFKINEKYVKGTNGKIGLHSLSDGNFSREMETVIKNQMNNL